jgi:hypothetical protein
MCVQLPFKTTVLDTVLRERVKFNNLDSLFFANSLRNVHTKKINPTLEGPWAPVVDDLFANTDSVIRLDHRPEKYVPTALIYDSKDFAVLLIENAQIYSNWSLMCSFDSSGKFIDGFVARFKFGHDGLNQDRQTQVNKDLTINITEESDYRTHDNYTLFEATWKFSKVGKLIKLRQKMTYGKDYEDPNK